MESQGGGIGGGKQTFANQALNVLFNYSCRSYTTIALKEASETRYWIKLMIRSELVAEQRFSMMQREIVEIIKILTVTINKLKSELAETLNIELPYLTTYSPNLNLIERFWKFVKKQCLYSVYYPDFSSFKQSISSSLHRDVDWWR